MSSISDPSTAGYTNQSVLSLPVVTREKFALLAGLTSGTVFSMCDRGHLPTLRFGRRVFINLESLRLTALQAAEKASS